MPKVNREPVKKSRISCVCGTNPRDTEAGKTFENCECGIVGQRDSGKRFRIKSLNVNPLAESQPDSLESLLLGEF